MIVSIPCPVSGPADGIPAIGSALPWCVYPVCPLYQPVHLRHSTDTAVGSSPGRGTCVRLNSRPIDLVARDLAASGVDERAERHYGGGQLDTALPGGSLRDPGIDDGLGSGPGLQSLMYSPKQGESRPNS